MNPQDYYLEKALDGLLSMRANLESSLSNALVFDIETSAAYNYGEAYWPDNQIVLTSYSGLWQTTPPKVVVGDEFSQKELVQEVSRTACIVAHNAKYELAWLNRMGVATFDKPILCTQLAEYVIAGNRAWPLSLEACAARNGVRVKKDEYYAKLLSLGYNVGELPLEWTTERCSTDVVMTRELFIRQLRVMADDGLLNVFFMRCALIPVLAEIESMGLKPDRDRTIAERSRVLSRIAELEEEFFSTFGQVNVKSGKQMNELLFDKLKFRPPRDYRGKIMQTPKGAIATNTAAMAALKPTTSKQLRFLELKRALTTERDRFSKYLKSLAECALADDVVRASANQTVARTHRLSMTGVNYNVQLQNVPREYKKLFRAPVDGWFVVARDAGKLEYVVAVDLAKDSAGIADILGGVDTHAFTADYLFHDKWNDTNLSAKERKELRTDSKKFTFKPLYGGSSGTKEQRAYFEFFKRKHVQITAMQNSWVSEVLRTGKLRTVTGLVFYWPDTRMEPSGYVTNTQAICNYPIQMFATADMVPAAAILTWRAMRLAGLDSRFINLVHDDNVVASPTLEEAEYVDGVMKLSFENYVLILLKEIYGFEFSAPYSSEGRVGEYWSDD